MTAGDGNGWVMCRCGHRHWGLHGAAGLLLARSPARQPERELSAPGLPGEPLSCDVLLQLRAAWTHHGGTWGLPGGAVDSHESPRAGALREAHEETGVRPNSVHVLTSVLTTDHVDWTYHAVLAVPVGHVTPHATTAESDDVRWVGVDDVASLPLHPAFGASWPGLRRRLLSDLPAARPS